MPLLLTRRNRKKFRRWGREALRDRQDCLKRKSDLKNLIEANAEADKIAIVYGFVDCDGAMADNLVTTLPANVVIVQKWEIDLLNNAEGRTWWDIARPSQVANLEETHRDLALEAFEEGRERLLFL